MRTDTAAAIHLEDYQPAPYHIDTVDLDIHLAPTATQVKATLAIRRRDGVAPGTPLWLNGDETAFTGLAVNGQGLEESAYTANERELVIHTPPAEPFTLEVRTWVNPEANTQLSGLYRSSGNYCTQCEAEGFRRITYFLDRPDVLSVYTTRIEGPKADTQVLLGNGNPVESGDIPGTDRHYAIWHDPHPKPSYLFAMVAGNLAHVSDSFVTSSGRKVDLKIYVEPGKEDRCDWAMDSLKRSMKWDEDVFGCEYDLDVFNIVAVSDFNMGAMENKGLNIFNDKYVLADPETATDQDYANIEAVIAHEYFHNWTGNRITCRDWFQLCLKEGLTVFRDQEFSSDMRSRAVKRISDVRLLRSHQFPEDAGPLAHPVRPRQYTEINNFYTATVYEKGAEVVRMLKTLLGDDGFRKGMDLYFQRHDGDATTIEAFLACFSEATSTDLGQFARWYEQAGTPLVTVKSQFDATAQELTLDITQSIAPLPGQATSQPAVIPIRFGLIGQDGADVTASRITGAEVRGDVLLLTKASQKVTFHGLEHRPVLSLLRGFSAPVRLEAHQNLADLTFLARHDSDPFNRWQAVQTLATQELIRLTHEAHKKGSLEVDDRLVEIFGTILSDQGLDPAFKALALDLPGEADIAREIGKNVDPDAIHAARMAFRSAIGAAHLAAFHALLADAPQEGTFSPDAASAGKRALAAQALGYFADAGTPAAPDKVWHAFQQANNMTDRIGALTLLVHRNLPRAEQALADFRSRHSDNSLAMDKWFTVQATTPAKDGLERVKALTAHPLFDMTNPNRMRSLIQAFATGNHVQFARKDGEGFAFIADCVMTLDPRNPQVAARLLTCFRSWRSLEGERSKHAEKALLRISAMEKLSRDCRDIVDRCLQ
ncbi:aminopeptidase N [Roseibium suaedae]|uniref:Aminopeptidase N n=1 Tax=Roseibium suaedae TaxID=735517 RepID=A0A1M7CFV6_9HYPH|nr:aminopeptidase N [Roseibium suaedae]SHL66103.1 aminopeptidase N [Roseibium suaedae]